MLDQRLQIKMVEGANGKAAFEMFAATIPNIRQALICHRHKAADVSWKEGVDAVEKLLVVEEIMENRIRYDAHTPSPRTSKLKSRDVRWLATTCAGGYLDGHSRL